MVRLSAKQQAEAQERVHAEARAAEEARAAADAVVRAATDAKAALADGSLAGAVVEATRPVLLREGWLLDSPKLATVHPPCRLRVIKTTLLENCGTQRALVAQEHAIETLGWCSVKNGLFTVVTDTGARPTGAASQDEEAADDEASPKHESPHDMTDELAKVEELRAEAIDLWLGAGLGPKKAVHVNQVRPLLAAALQKWLSAEKESEIAAKHGIAPTPRSRRASTENGGSSAARKAPPSANPSALGTASEAQAEAPGLAAAAPSASTTAPATAPAAPSEAMPEARPGATDSVDTITIAHTLAPSEAFEAGSHSIVLKSLQRAKRLWTFGDFRGWYIQLALRQGAAQDQKQDAENMVSLFAASMRELASDKAYHPAVRESGGVSPLVALIGGTTAPETVADACAALALLAVDEESCSWMLSAGAIDRLVSVLDASARGEEVAKCAACALANIAAHQLEWRDAVSSAGAVAPLVVLLRAGPESTAAGDAANALGNLAYGRHGTRDAVREAGALPLLVALLELGPQSEAALLATRAVGALCDDSVTSCEQLLSAGALPLLIELLEESHGASAELTKCASDALAAIAANGSKYVCAIRDLGGMKALVSCLDEVKGTHDPVSLTGGLWGLLLHADDVAANEKLLLDGLAGHARELEEEDAEEDRRAKEERMRKRNGLS